MLADLLSSKDYFNLTEQTIQMQLPNDALLKLTRS